MQKQFFDHFLKGEDNGRDERPHVLLQIRHPDRFEPREEHEWPLGAHPVRPRLADAARRRLSPEPVPERGDVTYEALGDGVTFLPAPLPEEAEVTGPVAATLHLSSSTTDADLFVALHVHDPDGDEVVFSGAQRPGTPRRQGWLRASHRKLDPVSPWLPQARRI